jgi:hypothetical protein
MHSLIDRSPDDLAVDGPHIPPSSSAAAPTSTRSSVDVSKPNFLGVKYTMIANYNHEPLTFSSAGRELSDHTKRV